MKDSQYTMKRPKKFKNIFNKTKGLPVKTVKKTITQEGLSTSSSFFNNKKIYLGVLLIVPLLLVCALAVIYTLNMQLSQNIKAQNLRALNYTVELSPYPLLDNLTPPQTSAQSAIITDADSQITLYSKNPDLRLSTASTAKIMTALVGMDFYQPNSVLTILTPQIEGSNIGFLQGEQFSFKDLLLAMFLPSSNEAAYAVAQNYPGGMEAFVSKMNEKARDLNLTNTHFYDPAGLDDDNNYTTVSDLAKLASLVLKNKTLTQIVATKQATISDIRSYKQFKLENLNKLLGIDGVNGIKTGTTEAAGEVLVTSKVENGHTFIIVVMKSSNRFGDTKTLMSLISNNIRYITPQLPESYSSTQNTLSYQKN